jgi:uncharacterized protein (DUF2141 family)
MILELAVVMLMSTKTFAQEATKEAPKVGAAECVGDLKMIVTGLRSSEGQIKFDLDDNAITFKPKKGGPPAFRKGRSPITDKKVEYIFKDIPCGDYAIKLYHDENMSQDLDKILKIPTEQYGFSNCPGCILPPKFEKAKFHFDKEHPVINIDL